MNPLEHIQVSSACDLCGADIARHGSYVVRGHQELLGISIPLSIVACRQCHFLFQPERFSNALLAALYERDTSFAFGESEEDMPVIKSGLAERQAVISRAMNAHKITDGAMVLDVGGGRGECCQHLVERHRVVVADTTERPPVDARIEKVHGLFSADLINGSFDVVVMNHVLEHVFSPTAFLASAYGMLKNGGILVVEVPFELYTPLVVRHLGDWRHVGYFCRATVRQFLERAGFEVDQVVLEEGCYGVRRLPVIRAVAAKMGPSPACQPPRNSRLALVRDMLSPSALVSLVKNRVVRQ